MDSHTASVGDTVEICTEADLAPVNTRFKLIILFSETGGRLPLKYDLVQIEGQVLEPTFKYR